MSAKVQEIIIDGGLKRFIVLDNNGIPIDPVMVYLKYLDKTGKSPNTLKTYCNALKHYFTFLEEKNKDYKSADLDILSTFVEWLRTPYKNENTVPLKPTPASKTEKTINLIITVVCTFYSYLYRSERIDNDIEERLLKKIFVPGTKKYKGFLSHIADRKPSTKNILKMDEPKRKLKVLQKEDVKRLIEATTNIRDEFLIKLLYETGIRIGEALSLFLEDFILDHRNGHRIKIVHRDGLSNGARCKTGERTVHISQSLMDLYDDYIYEVIDELELNSNHLFVNLTGRCVGEPLRYEAVNSLFKRISSKTGIDVTPHMLRHTHGTLLYRATKDIKLVQERLGHSDVQTTISLYVHPSDEEIREGFEKAQSALSIDSSINPFQ